MEKNDFGIKNETSVHPISDESELKWWVAPTIRRVLSFLSFQCALFSVALVHCSLKTTLKTLLEKIVIYEWIEAERAANQSVWDINIRVGDEEVAALTQCVKISRREEGKGDVSHTQTETQRVLPFAEVESHCLWQPIRELCCFFLSHTKSAFFVSSSPFIY